MHLKVDGQMCGKAEHLEVLVVAGLGGSEDV